MVLDSIILYFFFHSLQSHGRPEDFFLTRVVEAAQEKILKSKKKASRHVSATHFCRGPFLFLGSFFLSSYLLLKGQIGLLERMQWERGLVPALAELLLSWTAWHKLSALPRNTIAASRGRKEEAKWKNGFRFNNFLFFLSLLTVPRQAWRFFPDSCGRGGPRKNIEVQKKSF